jgi:hypothetical protein
MREMVRRDCQSQWLRRYATELVKGCKGHDFWCEIVRCYEFARDEITYRRDPLTVERVQDARRTIEIGSGDCDDKCVVLAALLGCLGMRTRFVVLGYNRRNYSHVYLECLYRGEWIPLDPTNERGDPGWEASGVIRKAYAIF